jgi:hypothetical protein
LIDGENVGAGTTSLEAGVDDVVFKVINAGERGLQSVPIGIQSTTTQPNQGGIAVMGFSNGGLGVWGSSSHDRLGTGVTATGPTGLHASGRNKAIDIVGRAVFSQAGKARVAAGESKVRIKVVGKRILAVKPGALILATVQGVASPVAVASTARVDDTTFDVFLSGPAPAGGVRVGYFVVN